VCLSGHCFQKTVRKDGARAEPSPIPVDEAPFLRDPTYGQPGTREESCSCSKALEPADSFVRLTPFWVKWHASRQAGLADDRCQIWQRSSRFIDATENQDREGLLKSKTPTRLDSSKLRGQKHGGWKGPVARSRDPRRPLDTECWWKMQTTHYGSTFLSDLRPIADKYFADRAPRIQTGTAEFSFNRGCRIHLLAVKASRIFHHLMLEGWQHRRGFTAIHP